MIGDGGEFGLQRGHVRLRLVQRALDGDELRVRAQRRRGNVGAATAASAAATAAANHCTGD
jgi:hypothetical protein